MTLPQLLVLTGELSVRFVLRLVPGVGGVVLTAIACLLVLPDPVLVASKLGLVGRDDPLVLQQMRFMFVKVRLDAS